MEVYKHQSLDSIYTECNEDDLKHVVSLIEKAILLRSKNIFNFNNAPIKSFRHGDFVYVICNPTIVDYDENHNAFTRPQVCFNNNKFYPIPFPSLLGRIKIINPL